MSAMTESEWRMRVLELLTNIAENVSRSANPVMFAPSAPREEAILPGPRFVEGPFFRRAGDPKPEIEPTVFPPEVALPVGDAVVTRVVGFVNDTNDSLGLGSDMILSGRGGFNSPGPQDEK